MKIFRFLGIFPTQGKNLNGWRVQRHPFPAKYLIGGIFYIRGSGCCVSTCNPSVLCEAIPVLALPPSNRHCEDNMRPLGQPANFVTNALARRSPQLFPTGAFLERFRIVPLREIIILYPQGIFCLQRHGLYKVIGLTCEPQLARFDIGFLERHPSVRFDPSVFHLQSCVSARKELPFPGDFPFCRLFGRTKQGCFSPLIRLLFTTLCNYEGPLPYLRTIQQCLAGKC